MSQERIEAAAKVGYERNVEHLVSFGFATSWEAAHRDTRVEVLAKTEAQLAAADAVMFSDEAIERAVAAVHGETSQYFSGEGIADEDAAAIVRIVVAALKGD